MKNKCTWLALVGLLPGMAESLIANRDEPDQTLAPYFLVLGEETPEGGGMDRLPLKSTRVNAEISGVIAKVEVRQVYENAGQGSLEAVYVFPGSTRAAVNGLTMKLGDRLVEAEIKERREAQKVFEEAKANNQTASLLQQQRPNVFQMNVAHILPGDRVEVTLRYTEHLVPTERVYEFVFPTVVGPRYSGEAGSAQAGDGWVANPYLKEGVESPVSFSLETVLHAGMPIQQISCGTHEVEISYQSEDEARVRLDASEVQGGNRDFILRYRLAGAEISSGLLLHEGDEENFFLLNLQPPKRIRPSDLPGREYLFVVDVSGSMNGFPLNTAKKLMRELVGGLGKKDRFNVLLFAGSSEWYSPEPVEASPQRVDRATRWMEGAKSGGGTELVSALERALKSPVEPGVSRSFVVVTDGYVSFEREAFEMVRTNLNQSNLFAFGIGSSVNRYLLEGLAKAGQGEPFLVTEPAEAPGMAKRFQEYVSAPVLTNIRADFGDLEVYDVEPESVPDLLADRPITIFGKWRGNPEASVRVTGISGDREISQTMSAEGRDHHQPALPFLWARERIAVLSDFGGPVRGGVDPDRKAEITSLGLTYSLLTRYTSFVAVDEQVRKDAEGLPKQKVKQPLPLPQGVPATAVGGGAVPEPEFYLLLLLGGAILGWQQWNRRRQHQGRSAAHHQGR